MILVKYKIKPSQLDVDGLGLFTLENIAKGSVVYRHTDQLDLLFTPEDLAGLPQEEQRFIKHYGFQDQRTGKFRLDHDDIRFLNYSHYPNMEPDGKGNLVAVKDIKAGEELTEDYLQ
jgi:hypothetical protein